MHRAVQKHDVDVKDRGDAKHKSLVEIVSNELNASSMIVFCNSMESCRSTEPRFVRLVLMLSGYMGVFRPNFDVRTLRCFVNDRVP